MYEKLVEMSRKEDYKTGNVLDYLCRHNYYKLIGIDLSRQINTTILQQINFYRKIRRRYFLLLKSSKKLF